MPIYEFRCGDCGAVFEAIRPMGDAGRELTCPECGSGAPEKLPSTFAAHGLGPADRAKGRGCRSGGGFT